MLINDYEVIILKKTRIDDFASERNLLLKVAKKDWVLFLDSDEKLSNDKLVFSDKYSGYKLLRKNYFLNQYVGSEFLIRLGRKDAGRWQRSVHEKWELKGPIGEIKNTYIVHKTALSLNKYITKINIYSTLHAKANKEEGKSVSFFKVLFYPPIKFFDTLIKSRNVVFSLMQSLHSFLSWTKFLLYYS